MLGKPILGVMASQRRHPEYRLDRCGMSTGACNLPEVQRLARLALMCGAACGWPAVEVHAAAPVDDGNWTMPAKDYASTRFSGLGDINATNVSTLQVAFTFSL